MLSIKIFNTLPPQLRAILKYKFRALTLLVESFTALIKDLFVPVYDVSESNGLKVTCIGHAGLPSFMMQAIYGQKVNAIFLRKIFIYSTNRETQRLSDEYDILIFNVHRFYLKNLFSSLFLRIPFLVRQQLSLPQDHADLLKQVKTRESQKDLNKIRRNKFTSEVTNDHRIFRFFYEEFHCPFINSRHGDYAYIEPYEKLLPLLDEGELLMVKQGNQYVSGVLCRRRGDTYETIIAGVYHADLKLVQDGVLAAEYFFSMERAVELKCSSIDFGRTHPFLNNGILHFKNKWNAQTIVDFKSIRDIGLHICKFNAQVCSFLEKNPVIFLSGEKLQGIIFLGENLNLTDKEFLSYVKYRYINGVKHLILIILTESWKVRTKLLDDLEKTTKLDLRIIDFTDYEAENWRSLVTKLKG